MTVIKYTTLTIFSVSNHDVVTDQPSSITQSVYLKSNRDKTSDLMEYFVIQMILI